MCHIRLLERKGTVAPSSIQESSVRVGKNKQGESKDFSLFFSFSSQKDMFLIRRVREIQQLVNILNMAVCSGDKKI